MAPQVYPAPGYDNFLEFLFEKDVPEELATPTIVRRSSVRSLCSEVNVPKSPDELLELYDGREEKLIKNLSKLKVQQEANAELIHDIRILIAETGCVKPADEMLASYHGREETLLKNLQKLKKKQEHDAEVVEEIKELVVECGIPKSADEMLASYAGREEALLVNMKKLKAKNDKEKEVMDEIEMLMDKTNIPKVSVLCVFEVVWGWGGCVFCCSWRVGLRVEFLCI